MLTLHHETAFWLERTLTDSVEGWAVASCPLSGCSEPRLLATGLGRAQRISADANAVYWTTELSDEIRRCADLNNGCGDDAEVLVNGLAQLRAIVANGDYLYFTDAGQTAASGRFLRLRL